MFAALEGSKGDKGDSGASGVAQTYTVHQSGTISSSVGAVLEVTASCLLTHRVLGGGYEVSPAGVTVLASSPLDGTAWRVRVETTATLLSGGTVTAYAVCAPQ